MLKDVLIYFDLSALSAAGLVLFLVVFVGVLFYALTRTPRQAEQWSRIPLTSETREKDPFLNEH
jgi:cbb3-type cytochrome oxidase subunit 3